MKIRILNASKMCVDGRYRNGDIVEVYEASDGLLTESESKSESGYFYSFDWEWQGKYFEIVDGDDWITWTGGERPIPLGTLTLTVSGLLVILSAAIYKESFK